MLVSGGRQWSLSCARRAGVPLVLGEVVQEPDEALHAPLPRGEVQLLVGAVHLGVGQRESREDRVQAQDLLQLADRRDAPAAAVLALSPVSMTLRMPSRRKASSAAGVLSLTGSATARSPASVSSTTISMTV